MTFEATEPLREEAARLLIERRRRDLIFAERSSIFGEPAWDLLLDLFARPAGREVAAIDATGRRSTQERFLLLLEAEGLIQRETAPQPDRECITLTADGDRLMKRFLSEIEADR